MDSAPEFGVILPQFATTWKDLERFARRAEDAGFDSVWAVDHLIGFPRPEDGILEAWTVMSALAAATSRISIGAQVLCQSFRSPALLAKMATTLDLISGDRLRFLVGAGWMEAEYRAFGYPFPPAGDRVAQLEDTVRICRGMFDSGTDAFSYRGRAHSVSGVMNVPAPGRRIPIGIGAVGDRMLDLVARVGDEWNVPAMVLNSYPARRSVLDARLRAHGRDVKRSAQVVFNPGNRDLPGWYSMFKPELGLCGSESQMANRARELGELGITGFYGFVADDKSLDDLADALPTLRATAAS